MHSGPSSASTIASASTASLPRSSISVIGVPAHALLAHPVERRLVGPVAAQPDLHEVLAGDPALLDQPAHRLPVRVQVAPLIGAGVGVRVEVDHPDASAATRGARPRPRSGR